MLASPRHFIKHKACVLTFMHNVQVIQAYSFHIHLMNLPLFKQDHFVINFASCYHQNLPHILCINIIINIHMFIMTILILIDIGFIPNHYDNRNLAMIHSNMIAIVNFHPNLDQTHTFIKTHFMVVHQN